MAEAGLEELEIVLERGNHGLCLIFLADCILSINTITLVCDHFFFRISSTVKFNLKVHHAEI